MTEVQINDTGSDLSDVDDVSILQTEHGNPSDIRINYSSDVSNVGTLIYDENLLMMVTIKPILPGKKTCQHFFILFLHIIWMIV